jgi:hypothetical protein
MSMSTSLQLALAVVVGGVLTACTSTAGSPGGDRDCVSHYDAVAGADTWPGLKDAMLAYSDAGRVVSVRTQARGHDVGAGDQDAVRVADLLDGQGRRVVQVDVWRTDAGRWRAGVWEQCID